MINICLCDDDIRYLQHYTSKINDLSNTYSIPITIQTFTCGEGLSFELEDNPNHFDIIIIDIIMKKLNGIQTAQILRKSGFTGVIIFLTSSKEYALDAFLVEPLNYIIKDLHDDERLKSTLLKAIMQIEKTKTKSIMLSIKQTHKIFNLDTISYVESIGKKVVLYNISGEKEEVNMTMNSILEKIQNHGFIRCHKSYIVNASYVTSFNKLECSIKNGITIPIGRKYSSTFKESYLKNELDHIIL